MNAYTCGGRTHKILARLAQGDGHFGDLLEALGFFEGVTEGRRRKLWRLLDSNQADGLIFKEGKRFSILPAGEVLLARLTDELGFDPSGAPRARIFVRAGVAA